MYVHCSYTLSSMCDHVHFIFLLAMVSLLDPDSRFIMRALCIAQYFSIPSNAVTTVLT